MTASKRLVSLDALRGLAALAVVAFHYSFRIREMYPDALPAPFSFPYGHYGVHLFFLISGFVILMSLERRHAKGFLRARFFRLYPVFWASLLLTAIAISIAPPVRPVSVFQFLGNVTMAADYFRIENIDGVYWSLAYELGFYAFMYAVYRLGQQRWVPLLPMLWIAGAAAFQALAPYIPAPLHYLLMIHNYAHLFACGLVFYFIWRDGMRWRYGALLAAGVAVQAMIFGFEGAAALAISMGLFALALRPEAARLPGLALLTWFGAISYALYLTHQEIGYRLILALQALGAGWLVSVAAAFAVMIGVATALTYGVEKPAQRRFAKARQKQEIEKAN